MSTGPVSVPQPCTAISREQKEVKLQQLMPLFERSSVIVGLRYKGLSVKQLETFRRILPVSATLMVCKNTLVSLAIKESPGWEDLQPATKGDNAWLFVEEEDIQAVGKAYLEFEGMLKEAIPAPERKTARPIDVSGGVMEGHVLDYRLLQRLETMPTRKELMASVARLIKQVPRRVALAVKAVPTKLVHGIRALADADEDKSRLVGDVLPKKLPQS